jgi:CHAT domain-containing protein
MFDRDAVKRIDRKIRRQLSRHPTPNLFADSGLLKLIAGRPDEAIELFEESVASGPIDSTHLSDLGAAYLARASMNGQSRPDDLVHALTAIEKSLTVDPRLVTAKFNQALALQRLSLRMEARQAWFAALHSDLEPDWEREEKAHIQELSRHSPTELWHDKERRRLLSAALGDGLENQRQLAEIVVRWPQWARLLGEQELLELWSEAILHGQERVATRLLSAARRIGGVLAGFRGDSLLRDSVAAIDGASGDSVRLTALVEGHHAFLQALKLEQHDEFEQAEAKFARAAQFLGRGRTPFAHVAIVHEGVAAYYCNKHSQALHLYTEAITNINAEHYPTLVGYSFWMRGVVEFVTAALPEALASHYAALRYFEKAGESAHVGFVHSLIAADLTSLGERDQAWSHRLQALSKLNEIGDPRRVYSICWAVSEAALAERRPRLALHLLDELLATVPAVTLPGVSVEAFSRRGVVEAQLSDRAASLRDIDTARALLPSVPDSFRERVHADLLAAEAQAVSRYEPLAAIDLMTEALAYYQGTDYRIDSAVFHEERAAGYRQVGDLDRAEADLVRVLKDCDAVRRQITDEVQKHLYIQQVERVSDDMIALQIDRNRPERALDFADRAHRGFRGPEDAGSWRSRVRVPEGQAVIEYSVLQDRVIAWVLAGASVYSNILPVRGANDLEDRVARFREEIQKRHKLREGSRLYDDLFRPLKRFVADAKTITFIPDKSLHGLPFSALYDERRGRYLVEDYAVAAAPSAMSILSSVVHVRRTRRSPTALVVAADVFDRERYPRLSPLLGAGREAKEIAKLYPNAITLSGAQATRYRFLRLLPRFEIIHIAGHAVSIDRSAGSAILLAPESDPQGGVVVIEDLFRLDLSRLRLVVLGACSSAMGGSLTNESLLSLADPFLRAGIPVVASLWDIPDSASARLFSHFHQQIQSGMKFAAALQGTQRSFLLDGSRLADPIVWAGIEFIGDPALSIDE